MNYKCEVCGDGLHSAFVCKTCEGQTDRAKAIQDVAEVFKRDMFLVPELYPAATRARITALLANL